MLAAMRAFAKSWFAAGLIGLLVISFAIFGTHDMLRPQTGDWVVKAGDRTVTSAQFKRIYDNFRSQAEQKYQQKITPELAVSQGMDRQVLAEVIGQESLAAFLVKIGVKPADELLTTQLHKETAFFDQVSGNFDKKAYAARLAEAGLTPAEYEGFIRDGIASNHFSIGMANGLRVPRTYAALTALYGLEKREVRYFSLDPRVVGLPPLPTDAEMTALMKANAAQLTLPEFRVISLARFDPALITVTGPVDPMKLQKAFEFKKDTLSTPEKRSFIQVPTKTQAEAANVAARLKAGETPQAAAKSLGVEAVVYADQPKTAVVDKGVADAAFLLTPGQVSGPIQGALGFAVIKLTAVTPAKAATLESMRPQLEAELRAKAAAEKVYDLSQKYDDAHASGASLPEAAAKAGAPVISLGPISAQGLDRQGKPVTGVTPAILKRAFSLARGGESDVEEAGQGAYFAVKVEKVIPPALPALEEIKPQLVPYMMRQRIVERLKAKSDELVGRIRKGDAIETVAASVGSKVVDVAGLDRAGGAEQHKELGANFLGAVFNAKPGDVFVSPVTQGIAIAKLVSIQPGDPADIAKFTESGRPDVTLQVFQDLGGMTRQAAQTKLKTKSDLSRARLAIGLDPAEVKKLEDSAKPADKKK